MKARVFVRMTVTLVLGLGTVVLIHRQRRPAATPIAVPLPEVALSELTRHDGFLCRGDASEPFTGFVIETYPDGARKSRSAVSNGLLHGLSEGWHTNRILQIQERFVAGVSEGLRIKWYPDGTRRAEAPMVEGKIHGIFRRWNPAGSLAEEVTMENGQIEGLSVSYYPSGALKARVLLAQGKVVESETWDDGERPAVVEVGAH